jgi:hypothetical protein
MSTFQVEIRGTAAYIQHRYPMPDEEEKFKKECEEQGIDPRKTSNVEDSWYRNGVGAYIPAVQLKGAIIGSGKGEKISGKGNMTWNTILKIGAILSPGEIAFTPRKDSYDFIHQAYVKIGTARVLRERPAFSAGWKATFMIDCDVSEIPEQDLLRLLKKAGRIGIGDNRPEKSGSNGTFEIISMERITEEPKVILKRKTK